MPRARLASARPALKNVSGVKVIQATLVDIARALFECAAKTEWVSGLVEERELERGGELAFADLPAEFVVYQHYTLMPMLSDRDYVISGIWEVTDTHDDGSVKSATLDLQSIERADMPEVDGRVRAALNLLVYRLEELPDDGGTRTHVECNVDPLGAMPQFMVNIYAGTWSEKTLAALEAQVLESG
ncbi:MAG: hypothetical protein AAF799_05155 [Myxococcota bacterium]